MPDTVEDIQDRLDHLKALRAELQRERDEQRHREKLGRERNKEVREALNRCHICLDICIAQDTGEWTPEQASEEMARHQQGCEWPDCVICGAQFKKNWNDIQLGATIACKPCLDKKEAETMGFCRCCQVGMHKSCEGSISLDDYGNAAFCTCPEPNCGVTAPSLKANKGWSF